VNCKDFTNKEQCDWAAHALADICSLYMNYVWNYVGVLFSISYCLFKLTMFFIGCCFLSLGSEEEDEGSVAAKPLPQIVPTKQGLGRILTPARKPSNKGNSHL